MQDVGVECMDLFFGDFGGLGYRISGLELRVSRWALMLLFRGNLNPTS